LEHNFLEAAVHQHPTAPAMTGRSADGSDRLLGSYCTGAAGPTVVVVAGIHGNEPAGIEAARRVLARLERDRPAIAGEIVVLAGNVTALERGVRFLDVDLNRQWLPHRVAAIRAGARPIAAVEERELTGLLDGLGAVVARATGPVYFVDLHTSSADGPPFVTVGDTLRNRRFARTLPLPLILGLEEQVDGALLEFLNNHGIVTLGVEGGQHEDRRSVDCHEAVLWLALLASGVLPADAVPDGERHRELLERASRGIPRVVEVRYRHAIRPDDRFRMDPGFTSFQSIRAGQMLGRDRRGEVRAPSSGLVLLPLYQGQGEDGFFVAREVRPFWLSVSAVARRLRLPALVRLLPGVRRHADDPEILVVNTRIARWYPLEVFHLLGFRKLRRTEDDLYVSRRRYDLDPPYRIQLS
jgi:succinylglutamate desuccinylase